MPNSRENVAHSSRCTLQGFGRKMREIFSIKQYLAGLGETWASVVKSGNAP